MNRISFVARASIAAALLLVAALLDPAPSRAQYIYLDTNGDGVHTDADVVNPSGPTHIARMADLREDGYVDDRPAGLHKLGLMTLNVIAGTPSLRFGLMEGWDYTCFGTFCDATQDFPNSYILGVDFFDADGAAYGGHVN